MEKRWVTDLENQNIDGSRRLRHLLMTCADPIETIKNFQERNSIKVYVDVAPFQCSALLRLPALNPALRLLDLHNIRRTEFHEEAANDISDLLLAKIKDLGSTGTIESVQLLEKQLEKSFKLYRVPSIRPFVLETLRQLPKAPDRYLKVIVTDREFYDSCAVTVRQQIWLKNDSLYMDAIVPVIDSYIDEKQKVMQTVDQSPTNYFTCETTKSRRQWPQILELMAMVGQQELLYRRLNNVIRERFLKSGDATYCSLRMELVMSAHDLNIESVIRSDPCHDLAWCLDACVRDKHLDAQQTNKLKNILDSMKKIKSEIIGDLAMIAGDAHVIHFLCSMAVKVLRDSALHATGHLPRELIPLQLLLRLLSFGASAHSVLSTNDVTVLQNVDTLVFTKFLASFTTLIVEDVIRYELNRAPGKEHTDVTCALLWIHYFLDVLPSKRRVSDLPGIMRYLKALPRLKYKIAFCDPWIHLVIHRLLQSTPFDHLLSTEQVSCFIIEEYLLKGLDRYPGVKYHLLRILHLLWSSIGDFRCRLILDKIAPEKLFESSDLDVEIDLKRYTQEYQRIRIKMTEKSSSTDGSIPSAPVTPVQSLSDTTQIQLDNVEFLVVNLFLAAEFPNELTFSLHPKNPKTCLEVNDSALKKICVPGWRGRLLLASAAMQEQVTSAMESAKEAAASVTERVSDFFQGSPFATPIGRKIEMATDATVLATENWGLNMEICDFINNTAEGGRDAMRAIRKRLHSQMSKNNAVVMYTLTVLETLLGPKFDAPQVIQEHVLGLIQSWNDVFRDDPRLQGVCQIYDELKAKGVQFPLQILTVFPIEKSPVAINVLGDATRQGMLVREKLTDNSLHTIFQNSESYNFVGPSQSVQPTPEQLEKLRKELDVVNCNLKVMRELLSEMIPGKEVPDDLQLLDELYVVVKEMHARIQDLIRSVQNDEVMYELLMMNDDCNNLFEKYDHHVANRACGAKENVTSENYLIEPDDQMLNQQFGALKTFDTNFIWTETPSARQQVGASQLGMITKNDVQVSDREAAEMTEWLTAQEGTSVECEALLQIQSTSRDKTKTTPQT
ncbi:Target of Myb protein 1 [Dirofilaria immitis]|nr:Target of Myb protein 1 [Dirofilaria immitis]